MLTVPGYVSSTWRPSTTVELNVFRPGTSVVITSTFPPAGQLESPPSVVVVVDVVVVVVGTTVVVVVLVVVDVVTRIVVVVLVVVVGTTVDVVVDVVTAIVVDVVTTVEVVEDEVDVVVVVVVVVPSGAVLVVLAVVDEVVVLLLVVVVLVVDVVPPIVVVVVDVVTVVEVVDDEVDVVVVVTVVVEVRVLVVVVAAGAVVLVVEVAGGPVVVVVLPFGGGHTSSTGRGLQMRTTWSLSVGGRAFARATTRSGWRPGQFCRLRNTSTGTSTKAPQAELRRSRPLASAENACGTTWRLVSPPRGGWQTGIAGSNRLMQSRTRKTQTPLPQTPSVSQLGSPSVHTTRGRYVPGYVSVIPSNSE